MNGGLTKALVLEALLLLLLLGLLLLVTLEVSLLRIDLGNWGDWGTLLLLLWLTTKGVLRVNWSAKWVLVLLLLRLLLLLLTAKGILLLWLSPLTTLLLLLLRRTLLGLLVDNWGTLLLLLGINGTAKALRIRLLPKVVPHIGSSWHLLLLLWRPLLLGLTAKALLRTAEGLRGSHRLVVSRSCP